MQSNKQRIIAISKELGLTHIGSNLSCLPILEEIYAKKKAEDIVILDNAHSHLAHLIVMYSHLRGAPPANLDEVAQAIISKYGIHCDRKAGCDASGGSLGHGLGIGIGYALTDRNRQVYITVSDGSMQEGSNWEALRIANNLWEQGLLNNLHIYCNFNGYTAVAEIDRYKLFLKMKNYAPKLDIYYFETKNGKGFEDLQGHYKKL